MMGNHDIEIRNHCQKGEIIVEVDGDDTLIGRQVMKVLNAFYRDSPETWVAYSNLLLQKSENVFEKFQNRDIPRSIYKQNSYRISGNWVTSHLKTYRREVYMKIPITYF